MLQQKMASPVRMSLINGQVFTLPADTRQVLILAGGAWLSLGLNTVVAYCQERIQIHPDLQDVTITPLGKERLEFMVVA